MKNSISTIELVAKWTPDQDMSVEPPSSVRWADDTIATQNDFLQHMLDTHTFVGDGESGMECRVFPEIVADVRYDYSAQTWAVSGVGVTPAVLALANPDAPDDQIMAALYTLPVVYRSNIWR